jgi:RimJ/RimL family protein N-acetyltransferase
MITLKPITLEARGIRLEPMGPEHRGDIVKAASDGELWNLWFTAVPSPDKAGEYIEKALQGQKEGHMLPWAVRDVATNEIVGSTRYHDVVAAINRVEIGYTFYAKSRQRTGLNTTCKLMLLEHAFDGHVQHPAP